FEGLTDGGRELARRAMAFLQSSCYSCPQVVGAWMMCSNLDSLGSLLVQFISRSGFLLQFGLEVKSW
ncbi:hypothetical protein L195_g040519, partial [Trifolium pratense]